MSDKQVYLTAERFAELCYEFDGHEDDIAAVKSGQYASEADRIKNFREMAAFRRGVTIQEIIFDQLLKHIQAIKQAIETGGPDSEEWVWQKEDGGEGFKQKFADARLLLMLLAGSIEEEVKGEDG